jgi:signal transduction histidine kinase
MLDKKGFTISNSGVAPAVDPNNLFNRFRKDRQKGDGLGLGLAIVKKICDYSGFSANYVYQDEEHRLEIMFKN